MASPYQNQRIDDNWIRARYLDVQLAEVEVGDFEMALDELQDLAYAYKELKESLEQAEDELRDAWDKVEELENG